MRKISLVLVIIFVLASCSFAFAGEETASVAEDRDSPAIIAEESEENDDPPKDTDSVPLTTPEGISIRDLEMQPLASFTVDDDAQLTAALSAITEDTTISLTAAFANISGTAHTINTSYNITIDGTAATALGTSSLNITQNGTGTVTLKNLHFSGGTITALTLDGRPGSFDVDGCSFAGLSNSAIVTGNGVLLDVNNCDFTDNTTARVVRQGASSKITIENSSFIRNSAGAILLASGTASDRALMTLTACYFADNVMVNANGNNTNFDPIGRGAAVYGWVENNTTTITNCVIKGNRVEGTSTAHGGNNRIDGGAICVNASYTGGGTVLNISGSSFFDNFAQDDGGAIMVEGSQTYTSIKCNISNCTFTNNTIAGAQYGRQILPGFSVWVTDGTGGAISFFGITESEITHSTFYKNGINNTLVGTGSSLGSVGGGGAVAVDTDQNITDPKSLPPCPVLSNNLFIGNFITNPASQSIINTINSATSNSLGVNHTERSKTGNVFILPGTDADLQGPDPRVLTNNGNVGFDNKNPDYNNNGEAASGITSGGALINAPITVENAFANTTVSGSTPEPVREFFGAAVGSATNNAQRFSYIPSPLTDEMYRDGSGPYYDAKIRSDVRGYPRDHFPNAGAVEIYWTKFDPGIADGGEWIPADIPAESIQSILKPLQFYLVTNPPPSNVDALVSFPRTSINNTDNTLYSFRGWESNQPSNPTVPPTSFVYPSIAPSTVFTSTKQTYTATWLRASGQFRVDFNLKYNVAGVTQYGAFQLVNSGQKAMRPTPDPVRSGHVIAGWYKDSACTVIWDFATETITEDTTIYAQWSPALTVFYDSNGGNTPSFASKQVPISGVYGAHPTTIRSGYTFLGWYTVPFGGTQVFETTTVTQTANHTLYAQWSENARPPTNPPTNPPIINTPDPIVTEPVISITTESAVQTPPLSPAQPTKPVKPKEEEDLDVPESIPPGGIPIGGPTTTGAWSLLSGLMAIVALAFAIIRSIAVIIERNKADDAQDSEDRRQKRPIRRIAAVCNLLALILFLILDDLKLPVVWINNHTLYVFLGFVIGIIMLIVSRNTRKKDLE